MLERDVLLAQSLSISGPQTRPVPTSGGSTTPAVWWQAVDLSSSYPGLFHSRLSDGSEFTHNHSFMQPVSKDLGFPSLGLLLVAAALPPLLALPPRGSCCCS